LERIGIGRKNIDQELRKRDDLNKNENKETQK